MARVTWGRMRRHASGVFSRSNIWSRLSGFLLPDGPGVRPTLLINQILSGHSRSAIRPLQQDAISSSLSRTILN